MAIELKLFNDLADIFRETIQVIAEVLFDMIRIIEETFKCIFADIIESKAGSIPKQNVFHRQVLHLLILCKDRIFLFGKDTVESADDREGQDDLPIFMRLVYACQFIGDGPDEAGFFVYICAKTHYFSPLL